MHLSDRSVLFLHAQLTGRRDAKCNALERFLRIEYTHRLVFVCKHSLICFLQLREIPCFQEFFLVLLKCLQHCCDHFRPVDGMTHFYRQ